MQKQSRAKPKQPNHSERITEEVEPAIATPARSIPVPQCGAMLTIIHDAHRRAGGGRRRRYDAAAAHGAVTGQIGGTGTRPRAETVGRQPLLLLLLLLHVAHRSSEYRNGHYRDDERGQHRCAAHRQSAQQTTSALTEAAPYGRSVVVVVVVCACWCVLRVECSDVCVSVCVHDWCAPPS